MKNRCADCLCEANKKSLIIKIGIGKYTGKRLCKICYDFWKRAYGIEIAEKPQSNKEWDKLSWFKRHAILWQPEHKKEKV